jgi:hypothetical protein
MYLLGVIGRTAWDHWENSVLDRWCIMQLQLVPNGIKPALSDKMAARWAPLHVAIPALPNQGA